MPLDWPGIPWFERSDPVISAIFMLVFFCIFVSSKALGYENPLLYKKTRTTIKIKKMSHFKVRKLW